MKPFAALCVLFGGLVLLVAGARSDSPAAGQENKPKATARLDRQGNALPAEAIARLGTTRWRHGNHVSSVAITPDGKIVASIGGDHVVRLWERETGKELLRVNLGDDSGFMPVLALSPDGKTLAVRTRQKVRLWEFPGCKELKAVDSPETDLQGVVFSPDGKYLAIGANETVLWDLAGGKEVRRFKTFDLPGRALAFSADGQRLATGDGACVRIWEVATGKRLLKLRRHTGDVTSVAFAPDGKTLASGGSDTAVRLWDLQTGKELRQIGHPNSRRSTEHYVAEQQIEVACVAFSPDGKKLYSTVKDDRFLRSWDVATGQELRRYEGHAGGSLCMALSADGRTLLAGAGDSCIRLWDTETGKELFAANGHSGRIFNLAFAADGKTLVSAGRDGRLRFWDLAAARELHRAGDDADFIGFVVFSPDGRFAATGRHDDESVQLWDMKTGTPLREIDCPHRGINGLAFSKDGKTLATLGEQDVLTLWEVETGKEIRHWTAQPKQQGVVRVFGPGMPKPVAFAPDGKLVATVLFDNTIRPILHLWETATGKHVRNFPLSDNQGENVLRLLFAPDGRTLVTASQQNILTVWDPATGKQLHKLEQLGIVHPQGMATIESVAFAPDGQTLAVIGTDSKLILWDISTGKGIGEFSTDQGWISSLAYSPDGRTVATGGLDTTVLLWDVTGSHGERRPAPGAKDLERYWQDLLGEAAPAFRARWALAESAGQSVPFLRERLRPAEPVPAAVLKKLLADLDSKDFRTREQASEELDKRGELVIGALRDLQKAKPPLEVWKRVEAILQKATTVQLTGDRLREVRGVLALEQAGTPEARQLLEQLARGVAEARVTQEAKAALERMKTR